MYVTHDIRYIGVNDHKLDLFEGQYPVPNGISYNSFVILDEKIAVLDTMDSRFTDEWLMRLETELNGNRPDYLVIHHMEPDHSASIGVFAAKYPEAVLVSSAPAFNMMKNYFGRDFSERRIIVKEGSSLPLGKHTLNFLSAPMVHWPEVMMSYESSEKILFSADGFGKFGANDVDEPWEKEARRYYTGIVGKFGANVQSVLKKVSGLAVRMICPLHGPVLSDNLAEVLRLYDLWSGYRSESDGVTIAYTSVYGHTKEAALLLASDLRLKGCPGVNVFDLARDDMAEAISSAFQYKKIVFATTTYNTGMFPFMHDFLVRLQEHNFQNRTAALIENGSWAPMAAKLMKSILETCKDVEIADTITIRGSMNEDNKAQIAALAEKLAK